MRVIGTAGHVDHGKSTLVEALTGIDPDRLKEEKEREMTIDLGFAWIKPEDDRDEIGIVDVPGHRDFVENMLAGVGSIDLALLVIAADEGIMPQTREHLAILDLLRVGRGVVALTKIDLVEDREWLELVSMDIEETLANTSLANAPIVPVSGRTGRGIEALKALLFEQLDSAGESPDLGMPRLPIDRVFSLSGFGTIVTGTLTGGTLKIGDAIELQPEGLKGRIRGLQTHKTKLTVALPGSRAAVNISGINKGHVRRGQVLSQPGIVQGTVLCDVAYRHLEDAPGPLKHNVQVKLHVGTAEVMARTRVIGVRQIDPGAEGWLQLATSEPVAMLRKDRFILRRPSPAVTIGGGWVVDPHPGRHHRRFKKETLEHLKALTKSDTKELLIQQLNRFGPMSFDGLIAKSGVDRQAGMSAMEQLKKDKLILDLGSRLVSSQWWNRTRQRVVDIIQEYRERYPLRLGIAKEELRSKLKMASALYIPLLDQAVREELVVDQGEIVCLPSHEITLTDAEKHLSVELLATLETSGVNSPSVRDAKKQVGDELFFALVDMGELRVVGDDVVYRNEEYEWLVDTITTYIRQQGMASAADIRDLLGTSRKYAIALLEHLDELNVTRRVGDERVLYKKDRSGNRNT